MVYMMIEELFLPYPWCRRTLQGVYEESRRKRTTVREISSFKQLKPGGKCVLLVGASENWINAMAQEAKRAGLHPIALSNRHTMPSGQSISSVMMDLHRSMQLAVDYLHGLGRRELALFGVNPSASSDSWRVQRFVELTGRSEHIFALQPTMEDAFRRFHASVEKYDGAICASDYAAVLLIRRLCELGHPVPERLYVVGYGDMFLSRLSSPSISSISDDYESFGRAALSICNLVEKNETVSVINIHLNGRLHIRESTQNRPYAPASLAPAQSELPENGFFHDPQIADMARLELLFDQCDEVDFSLLYQLLQGASYSSMAQQCYLSETAAKYRVKKMQKMCCVDSREALAQYIQRIIRPRED